MGEQQSSNQPESSAGDEFGPFDELERRVLGIADELQTARKVRQSTESEAKFLREQLKERDKLIAQLRESRGGGGDNGLRKAVRERVKSLMRRIDEMEREGGASG